MVDISKRSFEGDRACLCTIFVSQVERFGIHFPVWIFADKFFGLYHRLTQESVYYNIFIEYLYWDIWVTRYKICKYLVENGDLSCFILNLSFTCDNFIGSITELNYTILVHFATEQHLFVFVDFGLHNCYL